MKPTPLARHAIGFVSLIAALTCLGTDAPDNKLAPNAALNLGAKLVRPLLSPKGDYIYFLNQSEGKLQRVALEGNRLDEHAVEVTPGAVDFCLSPDGGSAYLAAAPNGYSLYRDEKSQRGVIQQIALADMTVTRTFEVKVEPFEIVADGSGCLYVTPGSGQWVKIAKIDPRRGSVLFSFGSIYGSSNLRITPNKRRLYLATNGLSPGNVSAVNVPSSARSAALPYSSPYHGDYPLSGAFDLTPDGKFLVNRAGCVLRLGAAQASDMLFVTTLQANDAVACDPATGKLWLATADGRLITYRYPSFELEKTEILTIPARALVYDAAHATLWVAWAKEQGGLGGLDAYDLQQPAVYPNEITQAREAPPVKPRSVPARIFASTAAEPISVDPLASTVVAADTETALASVELQREREANLAVVRKDTAVSALTFSSIALFLFALFFGDRTPKTDPLRASRDDPRMAPLPTPIKFFGWLGFFLAFGQIGLAWLVGLAGTEEHVLLTARVWAGFALLLAIVAFGVLRGNKISYIGYELLLVFALLFAISQNLSLGYLALILICAVFHYGRKNWEHLT